MKDIYIKDDKKFYSNIRKYANKKKVRLHLLIDDKDIINDKGLNRKKFDNMEYRYKVYCIHAVNIKDSRKRYSYIYDIVCDYLDYQFIDLNVCGFKDNVCLGVKNKSHCPESKNGCCYGTNRGLCKKYVNGKCTIKSISCKLFTCRYLRKQDVMFKINSIPLLKYFFNPMQKFILWDSIFKDKDAIIELLMKYKEHFSI